MRQPSGGYAASIDADAGGEEGGFHVWRPPEVEAVLGASVPAPGPQLFRRAYGLDGPANFEGRAWHLQRTAGADELAGASGLSADAVESLLQAARSALRRSARLGCTPPSTTSA